MHICLKERYRIIPYFMLIGLSGILACTGESTPDPNPPSASFSYASSRIFPVTAQFVNTSVSGAPGPSTFVWDFGDGSSSTLQSPQHQYASAGTYLIRLIQTQSDGIKDTVTAAISLTPLGPSGTSNRSALASFLVSVASNYSTVFTNNSTNAETYLWSFGDGTTSTSVSPTKIYPAPGTYNVKLTANGPGGVDSCSATISF